MTDVKTKVFQTRVVEHPYGQRILSVIGFEARSPTLSEMRLALDLAKERGMKHVAFPGTGSICHECDTCGVPVVDIEPKSSMRCSWCRDMTALATIRRAEPRMMVNGEPVEFGMTASEISVRAQICERIGVIMLTMAEDFRKMEPTETDTTFVLEAQLYTDACTAGVCCQLRAGHRGACQRACQACGGRGCVGGTVDESGHHPVECDGRTCQTCDGRGSVVVCPRCKGGAIDPYVDGRVDCQICEGVGSFPLLGGPPDGN